MILPAGPEVLAGKPTPQTSIREAQFSASRPLWTEVAQVPWVRLDEEFARHPKVLAAGPLGMAMQIAALCYCNSYLTDGFVPRSVVPGLLHLEGLGMRMWAGEVVGGGEDADWKLVVADLLDAGLWEEVTGGYRIHDFHDYQPTRQEVLELRDKRKTAGQKGGLASAQARASASGKAGAQGVAEAVAQAESKPVPVPVPVPTTETSAAALRELPRANDAAASNPLQPLRAALEAENLTVRWDKLNHTQISEIAEALTRHGIAALVRAARNSYRPEDPPRFVNAWLPAWATITDPHPSKAARHAEGNWTGVLPTFDAGTNDRGRAAARAALTGKQDAS
jgi:hypothetical protein